MFIFNVIKQKRVNKKKTSSAFDASAARALSHEKIHPPTHFS